MNIADRVAPGLRRRAAHLASLLALIFGQPAGAVAAPVPLGLCPSETLRLDGFMRAICDGESALAAGQHAEAIERFRQAAAQQRLRATNELAWAGLAAAYCQRQDVSQGRRWAARFEEARRIWLGELDCAASPTSSPRQPQSYVRDHMCVDTLVADYGFVRDHPAASVANEIKDRLAAVSSRLEQQCSTAAATTAGVTAAKKAAAKKPARKKSARKVSGKRASPVREK